MLGSMCPGILFPYAREAVSDLITRRLPAHVAHAVNFDAMYYQHVMSQAEGETEQ